VGAVQPKTGFGFDKLFGVSQTYVEFVPDILREMSFTAMGHIISGGTYVQHYYCTTAIPCGYAEDGAVIATRNRFGKGETLLIGTCPSEAYLRRGETGTKDFFATLLPIFGKGQLVRCSNENVKVRIQKGNTGTYLWALNMSDKGTEDASIHISPVMGECGLGKMYHCNGTAEMDSPNAYRLSIPAQDAIIYKLDK
jgi:beta-galactosidase